MRSYSKKVVAVTGMVLALGMFAASAAEARRGGSFGSRGSRTYSAPAPTRTAPQQTAPVQRSMTEKTADAPTGAAPAAAARTPAAAPAAAPKRGGMFGGLAGGLLGGLALGGLIGMLMGNGFGAGMAGFMSLLFQVGVIALVVWLGLKLFRRRQPQPAFAGHARSHEAYDFRPAERPVSTFTPVTPMAAEPAVAITVDNADRGEFETLLREIQEAFGREDYGALRSRTTPEIMSYLAEEMSQNALAGHRNEVRDVRLLEADVSEAWAEDGRDYVTAALRYESVDVMRDRQTGALVSGDAERPTETTELWTFVRKAGEPWKLSAIQEA